MLDIPYPRILLLEDDTSVRRFIQLALEDERVELIVCARLSEAFQVLAETPVTLVLTDLNLPDGSGLDFLQWLQNQETLADCRTVVFSGGIDAAVQQQLQQLQVWQVLHKPVALERLQACVRDALTYSKKDSATLVTWTSPAETNIDPVAEFFCGDQGLYQAYRRACLSQLPKDVSEGDRAARAGDAPALRHVAHNLKSALCMLGCEHAAKLARDTEDEAAQGATVPMRSCWQRLRQHVSACILEQQPN